ncbi:replication protein [Salipiger aestuarii]|uniref:ParB family chromosome partitioning protein n=1 Tax=Salipiger aestuarii TaxID=568098 RepID=A0A327XT20_9RHOB|nr:ParB N-terminal domain-containing protein [Salipiger aestuarii]KAB2539875.1 replication protein [Salipiger aestuarii]RAK11301.1 ParB family chromosome partitioning protein [Salipiger aestuarii]
MSKKRGFDIDFPSTQDGVYTGGRIAASERRGPMAAAISENAEALRDRAEAERAIREENDRLAHEHVRLKRAGLITDLVPIVAIRAEKLTRDRGAGPDPEIDELKASILAIGLSNPILVEAAGEGYELVQGFRRLRAFRELYEQTGDDRFARIPAGLVAHGEALEGLYRRMVDENLVRRDISFAEMAVLAMRYAQDPGTGASDVAGAVDVLFASAGRQKRSYIRHFATLLDQIGDLLHFPEAISRNLGIDLVRRLAADAGFETRIRDALSGQLERLPEYEVATLQDLLKSRTKAASPSRNAAAKTTLRCTVPTGTVRCAARDGRVELQMNRDFSSIDRHRLEAAVGAFMAALDAED